MALKDIKIEDLLTAVGFNPEDAETVSLDDIKSHVDTKYVLRDNVLKDEEIKKKITGKVLGSITTKAANIFGLKSSDVDGKQLEDVMLLGKTAYEAKLTELEQQAGKGNEKKLEELSKTLLQKEATTKNSVRAHSKEPFKSTLKTHSPKKSSIPTCKKATPSYSILKPVQIF